MKDRRQGFQRLEDLQKAGFCQPGEFPNAQMVKVAVSDGTTKFVRVNRSQREINGQQMTVFKPIYRDQRKFNGKEIVFAGVVDRSLEDLPIDDQSEQIDSSVQQVAAEFVNDWEERKKIIKYNNDAINQVLIDAGADNLTGPQKPVEKPEKLPEGEKPGKLFTIFKAQVEEVFDAEERRQSFINDMNG